MLEFHEKKSVLREKFVAKIGKLAAPPPRGGSNGRSRSFFYLIQIGGGQKKAFFTATINASRPTVQARNPFCLEFVRGQGGEGGAAKKVLETPLGNPA